MIVFIENNLGYERGKLKSYLESGDNLPVIMKENDTIRWTMESLPAFFIPNTYELYSNILIEDFVKKMNLEYQNFWKAEITCLRENDTIRCSRENQLNFLNNNIPDNIKSQGYTLTKIGVSILASIVEEEQAKRIEERPRIAGVYLNRLKNPKDYPKLQADPTVKFANNDFAIKRVLDKHTAIDNPYNTYLYPGFPPGPIRIPSINSIDAVLNAENHTYTFMCAGTNGYHKFTSSNNEHNRNKNKYQDSQGW